MAATPAPLTTKDNASGSLSSGINNSVTSIPLNSGNGAAFPQPYSSTCTSTGSATALNCTSISATIGGSAQVGKIIWNKTDGSIAVIKTVNTNALVTTALLGGSTNVWNSGDTWCIDPFVATLAVVSTSSYGVQTITQYEEALIVGRSTDTLTVATGGRGYNGTTANSFSTNDSVYLFVTSPITERLKDVISVLGVQNDTNTTTLATANTSITSILNASSFYAVDTGSSNAYAASYPNITGPLAAGMEFFFKSTSGNSGSATLTVTLAGSAQSAKTIKKLDGATNLASGDIPTTLIVHVRYDGTNFQMLSPVGQVPVTSVYKTNSADSTAVISTTSETPFDLNKVINSGDWTAGTVFRVQGLVQICTSTSHTATLRMKLASTVLGSVVYTNGGGGTRSGAVFIDYYLRCVSVSSTGGVAHFGTFALESGNNYTNTDNTPVIVGKFVSNTSNTTASQTDTFDMTTTNTLQVSVQFNNSSTNDTAVLQQFLVEKLIP